MTPPPNQSARARIRSLRRALALACLFAVGWSSPADAQDKSTQTPFFWQRDPRAGFDNEGRNHCAPVSIADGLIYLARARDHDEVADSADHDGQIALITELAADMDTDPAEGTNPDKILTGLLRYAKKRGFSYKRLELATWRGVGSANKKYLLGAKPAARWMTAAVDNPDVVVVFNFGWYEQNEDGTYKRNGGHWVNVVATGAEALQFELHNPLLKPETQKTDTGITLELMDNDAACVDEKGNQRALAGYYQASGPGLPFSKSSVSAAVLDAVIVFQLQRE